MIERSVRGLLPALFLGLVALPVQAQEQEQKQEEAGYESAARGMEAMMEAWEKAGAPGEPHRRLASTVGTWDATVSFWMDPSAEPTTSTATATREMVMDGRYLRETVEGDMMGAPFRGQGLTGYNNVTGEYESTWVDNHSTAIHTYTGRMEGDRLIMTGEYTDPLSGETVETRGEVQMVSDTEERYTSYEDRGDGMVKVMEIVYTKRG